MHRASTALCNTAAVFRPDEPKMIAQYPKQRCRLVNVVYDVLFAIDGKAHKGCSQRMMSQGSVALSTWIDGQSPV
jgi:hypothetical protein